jgi:hypothetical protein
VVKYRHEFKVYKFKRQGRSKAPVYPCFHMSPRFSGQENHAQVSTSPSATCLWRLAIRRLNPAGSAFFHPPCSRTVAAGPLEPFTWRGESRSEREKIAPPYALCALAALRLCVKALSLQLSAFPPKASDLAPTLPHRCPLQTPLKCLIMRLLCKSVEEVLPLLLEV